MLYSYGYTREFFSDVISAMFKPQILANFPEYYDEMEVLKNYIQTKIKPSFSNGKDFLNLLKVIMAKIAIQDFSSLSHQEIGMRIHTLNESQDIAFRYGSLANGKNNSPDFILKSLDQSDEHIEETIEINVKDESNNILNLIYQDREFELISDNSSAIKIVNQSLIRNHVNHLQWIYYLREFIKSAVEKRTLRVVEWVDVNLKKWEAVPEFMEQVNSFKQTIFHKAKEFQATYQLCQQKCKSCHAFCVLCNSHIDRDHSCGTSSHMCLLNCDYCQKEGLTINCKLPFGHSDQHLCLEKLHNCGIKCKYENCKSVCNKKSHHEGDHQCAQKFHTCAKKCSLPKCNSPCQLLADNTHSIHKCSADQCVEQCQMEDCRIRCACANHFHLHQDLSAKFTDENNLIEIHAEFINENGNEIKLDFHTCGYKHTCSQNCSKNGFCKVITERKIVKEEFQGQRDKFIYQKQFENIGSTEKCIKMIDAFKMKHDGDHLHSEDPLVVHLCKIMCPTCNNICEKEFGHTGRHVTPHGNMEKCHFTAENKDIDIGDHKYVYGESSKAELCHMFCKTLGRGHIHVVNCKKDETKCPNQVSGKRRHETCQYGPDVNISKDDLVHEAYWD